MKPLFTIILFLNSFSAVCQYNFYFGNIHSHSSYSDGNKDSTATGYYTPGDDYNYAKASYHMDFLGVSDHNHYTANNNPGMHVADYSRGLYQADTANNNGSFVAMYGFEWGTISQGGHVIVYGLPGLIGWETGSGAWGTTSNYDIFCAKGDFTSFWSIIQSYPGAFCTLAHPQSNDYEGLFADGTSHNTIIDNVVVGISTRSGSAFSTTTDYTDAPATSYESKFLTALAKGYHVGPTMDHDNHYTTFGRTNPSRTVVLSSSLHRDSIMAAYKANRFYATDDWNVEVNFTIHGNFMGSSFSTTDNSSISVSVFDPILTSDDNDTTVNIEIYYGIPESGINASVLISNTNSSTINYTHLTPINSSYYYFAKITQADGDIIWTSPIWVTRNAVVLPLELTRFTGIQQNEEIKLAWVTAQEINVSHFEIEHSVDGNHFKKTGTVLSKYHNTTSSTNYEFFDASAINGINFYRLKQFDADGKFKYSAIIPVMFKKSIVKAIKINPNPVNSILNIAITASENADILCKIYSADGREVRSLTTALFTGKNNIITDVAGLANGNYIVVIISNNERIEEIRFIKQ